MRNGRDLSVSGKHSLPLVPILVDPISRKVQKRQNEWIVTEVRVVLPLWGGSVDWEGTHGEASGCWKRPVPGYEWTFRGYSSVRRRCSCLLKFHTWMHFILQLRTFLKDVMWDLTS